MKFNTLAVLFGMFLVAGCGIEKKIDKASSKCEEVVSEALEGLEDTCLTKEEILELVTAFQNEKYDGGINHCIEDTSG